MKACNCKQCIHMVELCLFLYRLGNSCSPAVALFKGTTHLFRQTNLQAPQGLSVDNSNIEPFMRQNIYLEYHYSEFVGFYHPSLVCRCMWFPSSKTTQLSMDLKHASLHYEASENLQHLMSSFDHFPLA